MPMRPETYYAGEVLLNRIRQTGTLLRVLHDGGDIILWQHADGQRVSVHLIESGIPLYEIKKTLDDNTRNGIYTLFMLWAPMMIPDHDKLYRLDDWMEAFLVLGGGRVYGYDIIESQVYLFSVFLHGEGKLRRAEWGYPVRAGFIDLLTLEGVAGLTQALVARFEQPKLTAEDVLRPDAPPMSELDKAYALLGVSAQDDADTVRQAYYVLARKYHPDANPSDEATDMMQRVNAAYARVMAVLGK
ncbi:MAG: J domain-containing protein [Anaerolineae bacterium]|jgi:hypothetical protein|nr:J domain-containing protein [Anaerolineae bacterium]